VEYTVELSDNCPEEMLERTVADILGRGVIIRNRRGKDYDLRELIEFLSVDYLCDDAAILRMRLSSRPGSTGRPDEVMAAMDLTGGRIHRTALFFVDRAV